MRNNREEGKVQTELIYAVKEHLPDTLEKISGALLIWLFGVLVFLPAASHIGAVEISLAIALILLIAFSVLIFTALSGIRLTLPVVLEVLTRKYINWKKPKTPVEQIKERIQSIVYVLVVLIVYALYSPLLGAIHPSLTGLTFIPIVLWIFLVVLKAVNLS